MPQMNFLNLPAIDQAAQGGNMRDQAMEQQQTNFDNQQQLANTRFLAGSSKVLMDIWNKGDQDQFYAAAEELGPELVRRGIISEDDWLKGKDNISIESVTERYNQALTGLAGRPLVDKSELMSDRSTSAERNFAQRQQLVSMYGEGSPEVVNFDEMVRASKVTDIGGVPTRLPSMPGAGQPVPLSTPEQELTSVRREAQAKEEGARAGRPSTAQSKIDENFANEYAQLTVGGGLTDAAKAVTQLDQVYRDLQDPSKNLSGLAVAMQPRFLLAQTNPEALDAREQIEEIVQRNLRLILGAQFTEREGVRLIERAYNPALDEQYNLIRVGRLFDQIRTAAKVKLEAVRYYEQNDTLAGFNISEMPEMQDFYNALRFQRGDVVDGYEFLGGDATNRNNWRQVQ